MKIKSLLIQFLALLPLLAFSQVRSDETAGFINDESAYLADEAVILPGFKFGVNTAPPPQQSVDTIELTEFKPFISAFGAGARTGNRIDPSTATIYEVTNLNTSGAGSFRDAITASGNRIIIIKVEGIVVDLVEIANVGSAKGNVAVWGQFAPGLGLTYSHIRLSWRESPNLHIRFMTFQGDEELGCTVNVDCWDPLNFWEMESGSWYYVDHCSLRYGVDQIWTVNYTDDHGEVSGALEGTFANNILGQADPGPPVAHNTGTILNARNAPDDWDIGDHTFARNMFYDVSHRFPNINPISDVSVFNTAIVNWSARMSRYNSPSTLDWFANYCHAGARTTSFANWENRVNKMNQGNNWGAGEPSLFMGQNIIEGVETNENDLIQIDAINWFDTESETFYGTPVVENGPLPIEFFVSARQFTGPDWKDPADGIWLASEVESKITKAAGHNRGINTDGSPFYGYDDIDTNYITRTLTRTTQNPYPDNTTWSNSTFPGTAMYADTDGDNMPDWFETRVPFLDETDPSDMLTVTTNWAFDQYFGAGYEYFIKNTVGYTNLEMCAAFYAGDPETMIDGTNNRNIGDN
jgi:hypothetical protein